MRPRAIWATSPECVAALCPDPVLAKALMYRYGEGSLYGHSVKNLLLLALEKVAGQKEGLESLWRLCGLGEHRILPVTNEITQLCATFETVGAVVSETNIDTLAKNPLWPPSVHAIRDIYLKPDVIASGEVVKAIKGADHIIISPGDFYSSIIPTLLPDGIKEAFLETDANTTPMLNIMNKKGETDSYTRDDFVSRIEGYIGRSVDVIYCNDQPIPERALVNYALEDKMALVVIDGKSNSRLQCASFAEVADDGTPYHSISVLKKEFKKLLIKEVVRAEEVSLV